jgi:hypothetical protein
VPTSVSTVPSSENDIVALILLRSPKGSPRGLHVVNTAKNGSLRHELLQRHRHDSQVALASARARSLNAGPRTSFRAFHPESDCYEVFAFALAQISCESGGWDRNLI